MFHPNRPDRQWVYDDKISEYYVILDDMGMLKKKEALKEIEDTDMGES
jgi:hypothetical protein